MENIFNKARIQFNEMVEDSKRYFTTRYKQSGKLFTPATAWGQLLTAIISFAQNAFFYIEDSVTELNINTASRPASIRGLAALAGHFPTRAIAAQGELRLTYNGTPIDMTGSQVVIPNLTRIKCQNNGLVYTIITSRDDIRLDLIERNSITAKVYQGYIETQSFTGQGTQYQTFNSLVKTGVWIDNFYVNVYVNGEKYQIFDAFFDMPKDYSGCLVRTSLNDGIDVIFGDSYHGKIPPAGSEIVVEYLVTDGSRGNIPEFSNNVKFKFEDAIYDVTGMEIVVDGSIDLSMQSPITFGSPPEPIELTKIVAPHTSRNYVLATPANYTTFLRKFNYFSVVDSFTTFNDDNLEDDNVIYVFLVPDIKKRLRTNENYFTIDSSKFVLSSNDENRIREYISSSGSMLVTSELKIINPTLKRYILNISLDLFQNASPELVKQEIVNRLDEYLLSFIRRDKMPKSDIYAIIESIDGVDSVNLNFVCEDNENIKTEWLARIANGGSDPEPVDVGLDAHGDPVIGKLELPVIRGGWADRNGVFYNDNIDNNAPSSVNIYIKDYTPLTIHRAIGDTKMKNIKK